MKRIENKWLWVIIGLVMTLLAYLPVFQNGFINWDDDYYITGNKLIQGLDWAHLKAWFSQPFMGLYQPLVLLSFSLDYSVSGADPVIFHTTNLLLHLLNTLLVFVFISELLKNNRVALLVMFLFGLHPLHTEAVVWATERKELLYGFFYLLALISYLRYRQSSSSRWLWITFVLFILSLLSKASAVTLPLVLVLIDYWYRHKWPEKKLIYEKLLFLIPALIFGILTLYWHRTYGSLVNASGFSIPARMFLAGKGLMYLLSKTIWPLDLSPYNQLPGKVDTMMIIEIFFYWMLIAIALYALIRTASKNRMLVFGAGFFLLTIFLFLIPPGVPVMISERYAYIPSIGLFVIIGAGFNRILNKPLKIRQIGISIVTIYILFVSFLTFQQSKIWHDSLGLWNHVIEKRGALVYPLYQRGNAYRELGNYEKAMTDFNEAIQKNGRVSRVFENRGHLNLLLGNYNPAISDLRRAIALDPESAYAHCTLGFAYRHEGEYKKALEHLDKSIELKKQNPEAWFNRGKVFLDLGNIEEACRDLKKAIFYGLTTENATEAMQLINDHCR